MSFRFASVRTPACAFAFALLAGVAVALPPSPATAQSPLTATLTGIVLDAAGAPLRDARITAASALRSVTVRSGADGRFSLALAPDTYSIVVTANGFASLRNDGVNVASVSNTPLRLQLAPATLQTIGRTRGNRATSVNPTTAATAVVSNQTFIDQGQPQVVNVLDHIPGVEVNRASSNAPGANTSISLRGAQPYESQILIDGHPVVSSANGANGFNGTFINSLLLADVEVNKGPGNIPNTIENAVGGTLNFITPTITGKPSGTALTGYDSFDGFYYSAQASDTFGKLGVLVGVASNQTPGYLAPQTIYAGQAFPRVTAGTAFAPHVGVVDFGYPATQDFHSRSQLGKLSYSFSPQTSLLLEQYSTQTDNDETGTNYQFANATILPCIDRPPAGFINTPNCTEGGTNPNYTSTANAGLIGRSVPLNLYAPYPNTTEFDNEPIYSAEFRTVAGPGSFLARYYTGTINRIITQSFSSVAVIPCTSPACPNGDNLTTNPPMYNAYQGEPYVEDTIDKLHGVDAQYTLAFGPNNLTLGFDRHVDTATFGEYDPTQGPPSFTQGLNIQSVSYNLRGDFALSRKLSLESGNYFSNTTLVGSRFDPRLGLVYRVNPNAAVRASFGSAFVAPYYGLIVSTPNVNQGNLNLATGPFKPETSTGYDLGTDISFGRDTLLSFDGYFSTIFNRYASVTAQLPNPITFGGATITTETQEGNQAVVRQAGIEFQFLHAPRIGVGFHTAVDLLRDYAFNQDSNVSVDSIFGAGTPGNYVQLPGYPYSKLRNDLFYTFPRGAQFRISGTSYGANNSFGQRGFTEFDGSIQLPLQHGFTLNIGGTNIFNHDNYQAAGVYNGGPTYPILGVGAGFGYTTQFFVQPRTLYIQLQRSIGPSGTTTQPRTGF